MRAGKSARSTASCQRCCAAGRVEAGRREVAQHRDALVGADLAERLDRRRVLERPEDHRHARRGQHHRGHLLQLAVRFAAGVTGDTGCCGVAGDRVAFEHRRVHGGQVGAGVEHEDRPLGRHPVEVLPGESGFVAEVDRVEAADHERFVGAGRRRVEFPQTVEQRAVRPDAAGRRRRPPGGGRTTRRTAAGRTHPPMRGRGLRSCRAPRRGRRNAGRWCARPNSCTRRASQRRGSVRRGRRWRRRRAAPGPS